MASNHRSRLERPDTTGCWTQVVAMLYLLALAEAGQAEYLVTGNKELLELGSHKATKIISARDFAVLFDLNAAP